MNEVSLSAFTVYSIDQYMLREYVMDFSDISDTPRVKVSTESADLITTYTYTSTRLICIQFACDLQSGKDFSCHHPLKLSQ